MSPGQFLGSSNSSRYHRTLPLLVATTEAKEKQKNTLVSGNAGDQKNLHPGGHNFFFFNRFSGHILFSSLVSFAFSDSSLFFELKNVYSDTHWTMRGVSDKKFSPSRFQETRLLFFWSEFWEQNCMWLFCY